MQETARQFRSSCRALEQGGPSVSSANADLCAFQDSEDCGGVCLAILQENQGTQLDSNGTVFMAAKLLHVVLQRTYADACAQNGHGESFPQIQWVSSAVQRLVGVLCTCTSFAARRQLCRCISVVITAELFDNTTAETHYPSRAQSQSQSMLLDKCVALAQTSDDMLVCLLDMLREIPQECAHMQKGLQAQTQTQTQTQVKAQTQTQLQAQAVQRIVHGGRGLVAQAVQRFLAIDHATGLESALQCLLVWSRTLYTPCAAASSSNATHASAHTDNNAEPTSWIDLAFLAQTTPSPTGGFPVPYNISTGAASTTKSCVLHDLLAYVCRYCVGGNRSAMLLNSYCAYGDGSSGPAAALKLVMEVVKELATEPFSEHGALSSEGVGTGICYIYSSVIRLWSALLHSLPEAWCALLQQGSEEEKEALLALLANDSRAVDEQVLELLVEVTVLVSERHSSLLTKQSDTLAALRRSESVQQLQLDLEDVYTTKTRLMACLLAALALGRPMAASKVTEVLNRLPEFLAGDEHCLEFASSMLSPLMLITHRQLSILWTQDITAVGYSTHAILAYELGCKYRDSSLTGAIEDGDDQEVLSQWLQLRSELFQLLQGIAVSWPCGERMLASISPLLQKELYLFSSSLPTTGEWEKETMWKLHARKYEALLFMFHGLLECAFTSNLHSRLQMQAGVGSAASFGGQNRTDQSSFAHAQQVLGWCVDIACKVQQLQSQLAARSASSEEALASITHRCVRIWSLVPDILSAGQHSSQESSLLLLSDSNRNSSGIQEVLTLLCSTFEKCTASREASVDALLAISSGLRTLFAPQARALCEWLERAISAASQEVVDLGQSGGTTVFSDATLLGYPALTFKAPVLVSHFADKLHLILGRMVDSCESTSTSGVTSTDTDTDSGSGSGDVAKDIAERVLTYSGHHIAKWREQLSLAGRSVDDSSSSSSSSSSSNSSDLASVCACADMCTFFLRSLQGLMRGLIEAQDDGEGSGDESSTEDGDDIESEDDGGEDEGRRGSAAAFSLVVPSLVREILHVLEIAYEVMQRDLASLGDRLLQSITALVGCASKLLCKVLEGGGSDSGNKFAFTSESDVCISLLHCCLNTLTYANKFNENRTKTVPTASAAPTESTESTSFPAFSGMIEILIGVIRLCEDEDQWGGESNINQLHIVQRALVQSFASCGHLEHIMHHISVSQREGNRSNSGATSGTSLSALCQSEVNYLAAQLKLARQVSCSNPHVLMLHDAQGVCPLHKMFLVMYLCTQFSLCYYDAALVRAQNLLWECLCGDIHVHTVSVASSLPHSLSLCQFFGKFLRDSMVAGAGDASYASALLSSLLIGIAFLPGRRLQRTYAASFDFMLVMCCSAGGVMDRSRLHSTMNHCCSDIVKYFDSSTSQQNRAVSAGAGAELSLDAELQELHKLVMLCCDQASGGSVEFGRLLRVQLARLKPRQSL